MKKRISEDEVNQLYIRCATPPHVIRHCKAVSDTAVKIGETLNQNGFQFDIALVKGAGLAHDIARTQEDHGGVAADILKELGYQDEADIIREHMYYTLAKTANQLTECDLVCLADRLVMEDRYVGLDLRFDYILHKNEGRPHAEEHIMAAKMQTKKLMEDIEAVIGTTIDSLFIKK